MLRGRDLLWYTVRENREKKQVSSGIGKSGMRGEKKMKKRLLSILLMGAILASLLPVQAMAVGEGPTILIDDVLLVADGVRYQETDENGETYTPPMPAGVSYSGGVLTLDSASVGTVHLSGGSLTVVLQGSSTLRGSGDRSALAAANIDLTVRGPGSLTAWASGPEGHAFSGDEANLTFTGGAALSFRSEETAEDSASVFNTEGCSLTVEGGATLEVLGRSGIALHGGVDSAPVIRFADGTVRVNRLSLGVGASDHPAAPQLWVENGALLEVTSPQSDDEAAADGVLFVRDGARFVLNGGQVKVDTSRAPAGQGASIRVTGPGSALDIRSGSLEAPGAGDNGIRVRDEAVLTQSGGTLRVESNGDSPALGVAGDGELTFTGGSASLTGKWGISVDEGALTVNGGHVTALGTGGDGLSVGSAGTFSLLGGRVDLESRITQSLPLICAAGGQINLLRGTLHMEKAGSAVVMAASGDRPVTLGPGMTAVDDLTGEPIELEVGGETRYLGSSVTVSTGAGGAYACVLSIPSGAVTQGAVFTVRAVVTLGAEEGTISFDLPDGVRYVANSLTVDSQSVTPVSSDPLTVSLYQGGTVRFSAVASQAGAQTLAARVSAGGEEHRETLDFAVSAFNLSLPSRTARRELPVSGTAVPGSTITFYEGESELGTARVNSLGTWSGTVTLPEAAGTYTVHAVVALAGGDSFRSEDYEVVYAPESDEVKTLTFTTYSPGKTDSDPDVPTTVVIDYVTGESSPDYYSYWAELPTYQFQVDFVRDASAMSQVSVVTTNRMGEETQVPLRYQAAKDAWVGSHDYGQEDAPYQFRVEYVTGGAIATDAEYTYDENGNLVRVTLPEGPSMDFTYEESGSIRATAYGSDLWGEKSSMSLSPEDPEITTPSHVEYDITGRITKIETDDGASFSFSYQQGAATVGGVANGASKISYDDGAGNVTTLRPDPTGKNAYLVELSLASGDNTSYTCDKYGNITGVTGRDGSVTEYLRDDQGQLTAVQYVDGKRASYTCDSEGRVISYTSRGGVTSDYSYDSSGNLNRISYSTGDTIVYEHDSAGNVTAITENGQTTAMSYDSAGNLTKVTYPDGRYVAYTYDAQGRRTLLTDSDGYQTGYRYNDEGQLIQVTDGTQTLISYRYDADGNLIRQENANGSGSVYTYQGGWLSSIQNYGSSGSQLSAFSYTYDADHRIVSMSDASGIWQYGYDARGQLTEVISPDAVVTQYSYDAAGNRTQVITDGQTTHYTSNGMGQYTAYGDTTRTYDAEGNLLTESRDGQTARYTWNVWGQLVEYTGFDGTVYQYGYDAFGLRNRVSVNGTTTTYLNDPTGYGMAVAAYEGDRESHFVLAAGLSALRTGGETYYYHANHLGSVTELTDSSGMAVNRYTYDQQGTVLTREEGVSNPYTYVGMFGVVNDGNTLIYGRARYLSTQTNSFISMDPEGQAYDLNLYRYVYNDPVNHIDVSGESALGPISPVGGHIRVNPVNPVGTSINSQLDNPYRGQTDKWKIADKNNSDDNDDDHNDKGDGKGNDEKSQNSDKGNHINLIGMVAENQDVLNYVLITIAAIVAVAALIYFWPVIAPALPAIGQALAMPLLGLGARLAPVVVRGLPLVLLANSPVMAATPGRTSDKTVPIIWDPAGYVYEGIPSNRLEGVTTTLYYSDSASKPTGNAAESQKWDAARYEQHNPLTTDGQGQYLWMVPDGWWQVKYEKAGYQTAYSDWLPVPPIQTEVNVGLVSQAAATLTLSGEVGQGEVALRFSRPVRVDTVGALTVQLTRSGSLLTGTFSPVDAGLADDGQLCATTFRFQTGQALLDGDALAARFEGVVTYAGVACRGSASFTVTDPMPFDDVEGDDYFYDPVIWAVSHDPQITNGTDAAGTRFSPDMGCTRGQVVTFLWRAMGQPEPSGSANPFTDVSQSDYYYKAVLWAVEKGITNGTGADTFSPDITCSRGQIVTFLYRTERSPALREQTNPFTDVGETAYYRDAVLWAVEIGVTNGTNAAGTLFSPDATCTRGQIVTFLYRDMK